MNHIRSFLLPQLPNSLVLATTLILLSLPGSIARQNVTWCFHSEEKLLNLSCGSDSLIRIISVSHGWQNITLDLGGSNECLSPEQNGCSEKYPNIILIFDTCSGVEKCVLSSLEMPAPVRSCDGRKSNYVTVEYECVSVGNQSTIAEICGKRGKSLQSTTSVGYITSPNYPHNYDPNTRCSCLVGATGAAAAGQESVEIVLELLDFDISLYPNERSPSDWLRYDRSNRNWGDGRLISGETLAFWKDPIYTGTSRIVLNFNTDEQREGRGFWIKYYGLNTTSKQEISVSVRCDVYSPPELRYAFSCFDPSSHGGELYLSCMAFGVINVLQMTTGCRPVNQTATEDHLFTCTMDDVTVQDACTKRVDIPEIGSQCMRRTTCNPPAPSSANLTNCGRPNDFVMVEYQCISDSSQIGSMIDICGEDTVPGTSFVLVSGIGFITSPLYPSNYPPDSNCFCQMETMSSSDAYIVFYVLDLRLTNSLEKLGNSDCSTNTSGCSGDWLEYGIVGQSPGSGTRLSSEKRGEPVYTKSSAVQLNFHSDSDWEDRGFWIKYVGRSVDGSNTPVQVRCDHFKPQLSTTRGNPSVLENGTISHTTPEHNDGGFHRQEGNNTGLIVGLSLLGFVIVLLAVGGIVFFCWHRARKRSTRLQSDSKAEASRGKRGFDFGEDGSSIFGSMSKVSLYAPSRSSSSNTTPTRRSSSTMATFYNDAYRMNDPTLYREIYWERKRIPPMEETIHF